MTEPLEVAVPWLTAPSLDVSVEASVRKLALDRRRSSLRNLGAILRAWQESREAAQASKPQAEPGAVPGEFLGGGDGRVGGDKAAEERLSDYLAKRLVEASDGRSLPKARGRRRA